MDFCGRRVTVMGLGRFGGGAAAARWLARQGAVVTVTDKADEATLAESRAALRDEPIARFHFGGHCPEDFRSADLVVVNPAVRPDEPLLQLAAASGAALTSEIELFLSNCPAEMIGVTGSNGKSTTAAMTAAMLKADGRRTWLGGNLGGSLLEHLPPLVAADGAIGSRDWVVLELSSFQLYHLSSRSAVPHVAVVTGCTPNHLDWHQGYQHYAAAKQRLLTMQRAEDLAVLNLDDPEVATWQPLVRGRCLAPAPLEQLSPLAVPGEHNRLDAACAAAAAMAVGCTAASVQQGLAGFRGLPQRLEWFAVVDGRRFYNDSTATTPESTIAALRSLEVPTWLLAGGRSKGFDFGPLAEAVVRHACGAAFFGAAADTLHAAVAARDPTFPCTVAEQLGEALDWCWQRSKPGEAIVLSPACASTDQFRNFRQRGEHFVGLVGDLIKRPAAEGQ